jgi:hypothetical protein
MRGVEKLASVRRLYRTVAIDVCLFFYEAIVFSETYFRFLLCKAQLIGDWYENRRGARNTFIIFIISQYYWRTDAPFKAALSPHGKYGRQKVPLHLCTFSVSLLSLRIQPHKGTGNFGKGIEWEWGGGVLSTSNFYL